MTISYLALLVSLLAAWAAAHAAYINYEKLRLDLYNKRFDVYSVTVDFYQALMVWEKSESNEILYRKFIKSFLESRFLFKPKIYELLKEMRLQSDVVIGFKEHSNSYAGMPDELIKANDKMAKALEYWNKSIEEISVLMLEYLDFQELLPYKTIKGFIKKK
jgi:hypothetical protein